MRCLRHGLGLLLCALLIAAPIRAAAEEARLVDLTVTNTRDDLLLYLQVEGAFPEEMKQAILSGVPTTFSFFTALYEVRSLWFDREIVDLTSTHTIHYDNLKKMFTVSRSWESGGPQVTPSLEEACRLMASIESLKVIQLQRLEKGKQYQLRAKAELSKLTLPFYLHYILFFVSLWDFETDWYTVDFIY